MSELTSKDLVVGGWYRAKRFAQDPLSGGNNDRQIVYLAPLDTGEHRDLQYDSDTVRIGHHLPRTTVGKFLRWASHRINLDGSRWTPPAAEIGE